MVLLGKSCKGGIWMWLGGEANMMPSRLVPPMEEIGAAADGLDA